MLEQPNKVITPKCEVIAIVDGHRHCEGFANWHEMQFFLRQLKPSSVVSYGWIEEEKEKRKAA